MTATYSASSAMARMSASSASGTIHRSLSWIVEAALQNRTSQFILDGEALVLRRDGIPDFDALQSRAATTTSSFMPSTSELEVGASARLAFKV
jgi:hypothetical protein